MSPRAWRNGALFSEANISNFRLRSYVTTACIIIELRNA